LAKHRDTNHASEVLAFEHSGERRVQVVVRTSSDGSNRLRLVRNATGDVDEGERIGIAPWARSLARCRGVDDLAGEELVRAIEVLGDGELPERVPPWRRGCGSVALPEGRRAAVLTAWMPGDDGTYGTDRGDRFATAPAAVVFAASLAEGVVFACDASQGVLIVAANGPEGLVVRALRESPAALNLDANLRRRLGEAATAAGLGEAYANDATDAAVTPWEGRQVGWTEDIGLALQKKFDGWPREAMEAAEVLLPACAGALAISTNSTERALTTLLVDKPLDRPSATERANTWLSSRRNVVFACVVCALTVLFFPLLVAIARESMLATKVERAEALRTQYEADARTAAIFGQLNERVWPMTKMLAEISAAAPVHVVLESVRLDANAQIDIEGFVQVAQGGPQLEGPPEGLLSQYEASLNELGTLGSVTVVRREVSGASVEFQITAQVERSTAMAKLPMDFAQMPLAQVLYGEGATNTAAPILAAAPASSGRSRAPVASSRRGNDAADRDAAVEAGREASSDRRPSGSSGPSSIDGVPAALTDAQIAGMDRTTLMTEWRVRLSASRDEENDAETRARLKEEADKLIARSREIGSGG